MSQYALSPRVSFIKAPLQSLPLSAELLNAQDRLKRITMLWASQRALDGQEAAALRHKAALELHKHYYLHIPFYRQICERMGVGEKADFETIVNDLLIPDDMFKSYPQSLLDEGDFDGMNRWVSSISTARLNFDTAGIETLDQWLAALKQVGLRLVFSSGASGHLSFVPKDERTWKAFAEMPFLGTRPLLSRWETLLVRQMARVLPPSTFAYFIQRFGLGSLDGYFFDFSGGNQGMQLAMQELGKRTRSATFLYNRTMSATAVRAIVQGARTEEEIRLVDEFLDTTVSKKEKNYEKLLQTLQRSIQRNHRVMLFGTPALMLEVCRTVARLGLKLKLPKGSIVSHGGGWKSFTGIQVSEEELLSRMQSTFGVKRAAIVEGYTMSEINGLMQKCSRGHFHIPPFLEPIVYDEDLTPKSGDEITGTLGIIDPFATSYPGFVLTGDNVILKKTPCECGLPGTWIMRVARSPGKDVKGCGGIMATVNA
ncbi:MAG: hypothetical protein ACE5HC_16005 [Candidatus Binatia bacterium]